METVTPAVDETEDIGVGWYEWNIMPEATTHIAYLYESGRIYLPEGDVTKFQFMEALSGGHTHLLVHADSVATDNAKMVGPVESEEVSPM
jgi:hypothetical protein